VATLGRWWQQAGRALYPNADRVLVTADAGGSNGYRVRAWKTELARFAAEAGLEVTVCHFPPGTSNRPGGDGLAWAGDRSVSPCIRVVWGRSLMAAGQAMGDAMVVPPASAREAMGGRAPLRRAPVKEERC
jgi:Rhodopirellula transposase DDE domain